jgi:DNA-binding response OmpR family regulator
LAQAERAIEDNNVSAAILDFRLGDTTALPLAAQLRRHGIPFVFFTGQSNTGLIETACPGAKIIGKPSQSRTIVAALADALH